MNQCKINNSLSAAVKEGKWGNPGAGFYNKLTTCHDLSKIGNSKESYDSAKKEGKIKRWQDFVSEAYLTCGRLVEGPHGECATPFSKSGCKYPHHVFRDGELVVSIPGLKAAYSRAKQMGAFKGSIKEHLMRHYKELGLYDDSTMNIEESMDVTLLESYGEAVRRHIYDLTTDTLDGEKVDINNSDEFCPIRLSNIPNYMGINLCSVHSVEWSELTDGQLVDVTVKFNPAIEPDVMEERTICFPTVEDFENTDKLLIEKNFFEITKSLSKYYPELMTQSYGGLPVYESSIIPSRVNTPEELSKWMRQNISYGWISKEDGKNHGTGDDDDENYFYKYYRLSSPEDTVKNETGVCWDTVEVERQWFKEHDIPFYIFYIELNDGENQPTHTFLMYHDQVSKKYCWIDPIWMGKISQYDSPLELMKDVLKHHRAQHRDQKSDCICRYLARRPKFGITCDRYMSYAHKSKLVNVDSEYFDEDYSIDLTGKSPDEKITESFDWIEHFMEDTSFMESYSKAMDCPSVDKFMQYLNTNIRPGWVTKGSDRIYDIGDASSFNKLYRLQSPNRICKTRAGISWDICELERSWFTKHSYMFAIFFLEIQDRQFTPQHTFAVFYENRRYWWFEFGWSEMRGIRPYETLNQLLEDVIKRWRIANGSDFVSPIFLTWLTDSPRTNCTAQEYSDWAHKQKLINVSKLPSKLFNEKMEGRTMDDDLDWITKFIMEEGEESTGNPQTTPEDENEPGQEQQNQAKEEAQTPQDDDPPPMEAPSEEDQPSEETPEENQEKEEPEPPQQTKSQQPTQAPQKESYPKQTDRAEKDKNGVRRKKLYIAFIEWCKEYNDRNAFGSIFDKDAFKVSYPFVPDEMRYFYRLANPMLCVLGGDLTFFPVAELRKLNAKNKQMNELFIFAATQKDLRVFNVKDKKVYLATESNGTISLGQVLGDTFDIYIQNMIQQGDILNGPIETTEVNSAE